MVLPGTIRKLQNLASGMRLAIRHAEATYRSRPIVEDCIALDERRLNPVSRQFGLDRGQPIDRYYIESFLQAHRADIRGRVLEIGDRTYTRRFGGSRVARSEVLHAAAGNPSATIIGDLASGNGIPRQAFDCIILTQTLPFIYDVQAAIAHTFSALRDGGVVLASVPGISQISRYDMDRWGDYWRFTNASIRKLFDGVFGMDSVTVETRGNVFSACSFLRGIAAEELTPQELETCDPDYQLILTVRAVRKAGAELGT